MDVNTIISCAGVLVAVAGFWFGVVKFVSGKLHTIDEKIDVKHREVIAKIDDVKEKYVRHEYLELEIKSLSDDMKRVERAVSRQSTDSSAQNERIFNLLSSRRDDRN